jgi:hypothetical protein
MKNRALFLVSAVAVAVSACNAIAPMGYPAPGADPYAAERADIRSRHAHLRECDAEECSVTVTVTSEPCDRTKIKADPEELAVVRTRRGVLIKWEVTTPGYTFDRRDGIFFKDPQNQFQCRPRNRLTEFECRNKNDDRKDYAYGITLVKDGAKCVADPTIINGF